MVFDVSLSLPGWTPANFTARLDDFRAAVAAAVNLTADKVLCCTGDGLLVLKLRIRHALAAVSLTADKVLWCTGDGLLALKLRIRRALAAVSPTAESSFASETLGVTRI